MMTTIIAPAPYDEGTRKGTRKWPKRLDMSLGHMGISLLLIVLVFWLLANFLMSDLNFNTQ